MLTEITATDCIAAIAIAGGYVLMAFGVDGVVQAVVLGVAAYYFGRRAHMKAK